MCANCTIGLTKAMHFRVVGSKTQWQNYFPCGRLSTSHDVLQYVRMIKAPALNWSYTRVKTIDINTSGLLARLQRALSKMAQVWECLLMKLTADQYYFVYFCMFEEPAMLQSLLYSSEFVSIRQPLVLSTDNASLNAKNIRAGSPDLFMSMN